MIAQFAQSLRNNGESLDEMMLGTRTRRILLAEDDSEMRRLLASALARDGCEVIEARDGHELLTYIGAVPARALRSRDIAAVDLIISDVRMPGHTGLEVLAGLRRADWATPFILLTAFGSDEVHREAQRLGAAAICDKPFEMNQLMATVSALLPGGVRSARGDQRRSAHADRREDAKNGQGKGPS